MWGRGREGPGAGRCRAQVRGWWPQLRPFRLPSGNWCPPGQQRGSSRSGGGFWPGLGAVLCGGRAGAPALPCPADGCRQRATVVSDSAVPRWRVCLSSVTECRVSPWLWGGSTGAIDSLLCISSTSAVSYPSAL